MAVTKVFEIKLVGNQDVVKGIQEIKLSMTKLAAEIVKTKEQLAALQTGNTNNVQVDILNNKLKTLESNLSDLSVQRKINEDEMRLQEQLEQELTKTVTEEESAYVRLNQQYKEAKANAQEMAARFGVESEQAILAAQAADRYKQQLAEINQLVKTGGASAGVSTPSVADIPLTTNVEGLKEQQEEIKKTGVVVSEFDRQQAEAAISAKEYGDAQHVVAEKTTEIKDSFIPLKGVLDEYTGGLRDNIKAQIENATSLAANRASQKEIEVAMRSAGGATRSQIEQLAALKEEELILIETNKQLSVTIRNQAKEFIASTGSIDEMQAQLNQLQQSYEMLSQAERDAPFGKELKAQIDVLEPRVKEFEASIGRFSRNVGNYPSTFTPAFKVLSKELDTIQGKLVKGSFGAKEIEDLTRKEAALANMTKVLGTTFATTASEQAAYKEAARQLGVVFGTDSVIFKNFTTQVGLANAELRKSDNALTIASGAGNKATGAFQKFYGVLRNVANIIPGIGIAGLVGLILVPLESFGAKLVEWVTKSSAARTETEKLADEYKKMGEAVHESSSQFVSAVATVESLRINIDLAKRGILDKNDVLKQYNDTIGKTTGQVSSLDEAEKELVKNGDAYIQMTLLKAAANIALESAAKKAFEAAETRRKKEEEFTKITDFAFANTGGDPEVFKKQEAERKRLNEKRREDKAKEAEKEKDTLLNIAKDFQKQAADIAKNFNFNFFEQTDPSKSKGSKVETELQEALKRIEAIRLRQIAQENNFVNEIQKIRNLSFDEEILHIKKVEKINVDALNQKIALFEKRKKLNNEEKKTLAEFVEQRSSIELQASKKIQEVEEKRFEKQRKELEINVQKQIQLIKDSNDIIQNDPTLSQTQKAQAYLDADKKILAIEEQFYADLIKLNQNFNKEAVEKAKMGIDALKKAILADRRKVDEAVLQDIRDAGEKQILQFKIYFEKVRNAILNNDKLTFTARKAALDKLARLQTFTIMSAELAKLELEFARIQLQYDLHLLSEKKFLAAKEALEKKRAEHKQADLDLKKDPEFLLPSSGSTKKALTENLNESFGFEEGSKEAQLMAEIIQESFSLATDAMNAYFDAQRERIEQQKQFDLERLEREKERVKARATSAAEEETIERQFAQKKRIIEKKAGEELKKQKRAEAKIALATELANIAASAAANVLNGITFGAAGIIQYAIMSALALGRYAVNVAAINAQQFAKGGKVQPNEISKARVLPNGKIVTPSNIRTQLNSDNVIATVRRGEVILNEKQQKLLGGPSVFKKIGVPGFATGGLVTAPQLGTSLRPPVFTSTNVNSTVNNNTAQNTQDFKEIKGMISDLASIVYSTDSKEVKLVTGKVTNAQKRNDRDVRLASI